MNKLSDSDIEEQLSRLSNWRIEGGQLKKDFEFKDFTAAFSFMTYLAKTAEQMNHHPDWSNSYNKVSISLTTHHAGGLTEKDFEFAAAADTAFAAS